MVYLFVYMYIRDFNLTCGASARRCGDDKFKFSALNRVIAKDVKRRTYSCYVRCATSNSMRSVGGGCQPHTGSTHYQAPLGLPDKGRAIKEFLSRAFGWVVTKRPLKYEAYPL